jgi:hypothetical protein
MRDRKVMALTTPVDFSNWRLMGNDNPLTKAGKLGQ